MIAKVLTAMHQPQLSVDVVESELQKKFKNPHLMELPQMEQVIRNIAYKAVFGGTWAAPADNNVEGFV